MRLSKRESEEHWHVEVTTEAGCVQRLSTFCKTKAEAEEVVKASKIKDIERSAKIHRLTADVVTLITANKSITMRDALAEWIEWMKVGVRSPRTRDNNATTISLWIRQTGIEEKTIGTVTTDEIHAWINDTNRPDKLGTRTMKLAAIRNLMRFCGVKRYILSDPSQLVSVDYRVISHEQRETKHKLVFEDDEIDFILANCEGLEPDSMSDGFFHASIMLGRDLALRLGDVCNLEWSCFDFEKGTVTVWTDKANTRVVIPMTDRVARLVRSMERMDKRFLFPAEQLVANDPKRRPIMSVYFGRLFKSLGFEGYSYHSLRATMATTMAAKGATIEEIAKALGHNGTSSTKSYIRKSGSAKPSLAK
jgi:integrase